MRYASIFSGVEAATLAWEPLGWEPVAFSEIEPFPCAVLAERWPDVPNLGDITKVDWKNEIHGAVDLVVGGSPCQSFSVAGKREGLKGASGLMFEYIRCVQELRPRWFLWENVPGALTSENGEAFGQLLSEMDELGYSLAWRVLDAQFFGVAQRRRRLFLVGHLGAESPAEVLFEPESMRGGYPSSREKREALAAASGRCVAQGGDAGCLNPADPQSKRIYTPESCAPTLSSGTTEGMNIQPSVFSIAGNIIGRRPENGGNGGGFQEQGGGEEPLIQDEIGGTPSTVDNQSPACMADTQKNTGADDEIAGTIGAHASKDPPVVAFKNHRGAASGGGTDESEPIAESGIDSAVRRLTPLECERLQGFPDNHTRIPWKGKPAEECPDSLRYRAIGNSMAVPVMRWLGERIEEVDGLFGEEWTDEWLPTTSAASSPRTCAVRPRPGAI